jgi:hypothetical protein
MRRPQVHERSRSAAPTAGKHDSSALADVAQQYERHVNAYIQGFANGRCRSGPLQQQLFIPACMLVPDGLLLPLPARAPGAGGAATTGGSAAEGVGSGSSCQGHQECQQGQREKGKADCGSNGRMVITAESACDGWSLNSAIIDNTVLCFCML